MIGARAIVNIISCIINLVPNGSLLAARQLKTSTHQGMRMQQEVGGGKTLWCGHPRASKATAAIHDFKPMHI